MNRFLPQAFLVLSAALGVSGGSAFAFTRPGTPPEPNSSDTVLVTKIGYDAVGRQQDVTDNAGKVTRTEYDDLAPVRPTPLSTTGSVLPSPWAQINRSMAVGTSLRCLRSEERL